VDNTKEFTHLGLCAGYGGIELGLQRVIRNLRTVALCEIEAFACANLVAKMEAGLMDPAPIWTDLKTFPWSEFRDRVDLLTGGYPCQPFSAAGKRLGTEDPRHLWPFIADGIRILRPKLCFFENVEGHISLGLREVIGELGAIGYTAAWGIFSASVDAGAPHQRKRVFILAVSNSLGGAAGLSRSLAWNERIAGEFDHGGGEGNSMAESSPQHAQGCIDGMLRREDREDGLPWEHRGSSISCGTAWPSRPGEPQHAWEPPRVVADSKKSGRLSERVTGNLDGSEGSQGGGGDQSTSTSPDCGDAGAEETTLANDHRPHAGHGEQRPERTHRDLSGGCGEAVGNASQREDHGRESRDMAEESGCGTGGDHAADCTGEGMGNADPRRLAALGAEHAGLGGELCVASAGRKGAMGNPNSPRPQERPRQRGAGIQGADADGGAAAERQTQSPLGRDADGPAHRLDDAELYVTCDNRTDELRLLGNGVVPATAERAFLTLSEELLKGII
jgi:DNA (cytosine-5)-methyltransferase 1